MRADVRTRNTVVFVAALAMILAGWAVIAQADNDRPATDEIDVLYGAPDPGVSVVEDHLAWSLALLNGAETDPDALAERLSTTFLAEMTVASFTAETDALIVDGPYRLDGIIVDEGVQAASALVRSRTGETFALSVSADPTGRIGGLFIVPVDLGSGPFSAADFAVRLASGLAIVAMALALLKFRAQRAVVLTACAGLLCLAQLLELADTPVLYTVGLVAGPFAVALLAVAMVRGPDGCAGSIGGVVIAVLVGVAACVAVLPLTAIDTAAISLPDQVLSLGTDRDLARQLIGFSGWLTAAVAAIVVYFLLLRQFRADWTRDRGMAATTLGGVTAAILVAVPALSAAVDLGHVDLSSSLLVSIATVVAAVGLTGSAFWQRYDLGPAAAVLEAENTQLHVELATQLAEVQASRARIVHAGEQARRRIERDLHDGAQQRLVALRLAVQLGRRRLGEPGFDEPALDEFLHGVDRDLGSAVEELRELSRGLHPSILEQGVVAAAQSLAETSTLPVTVTANSQSRCRSDVEHACYFVISEALVNAGRHANATHVDVVIGHDNNQFTVTITDDGVGGARPSEGSGLVNLEDRVRALGGRWHLASVAGQGTTLTVSLPCE